MIEPAMSQPPQRREIQSFAAALYFPNKERTQLICSIRTLRLVSGQTRADAVMYALLRKPEEEGLTPLFDQNVYTRSVTVCRDLVTVNLSIDESDLKEEELVTACMAITASLTQISGVSYARVLFNGRE
ncbi:MAG: GerMN domain-containing protein, partial [Clostridiales bacterium]|nr:GerMN domain-containing protein [Clostridiales bacterium]